MVEFNSKTGSEAGKMSSRGISEKTKQWELLGEKITGGYTKKVCKYLDELPEEKLFQAYLNLLEYFKPKIARTEITSKDGEELTINIIHYDKK